MLNMCRLFGKRTFTLLFWITRDFNLILYLSFNLFF